MDVPPPYPPRDDRDAVIAEVLDRLPDRVAATLAGDRESLIGLLLIAADTAWQARAQATGTVQSVADEAHAFADAVADCYSEGRAPSDRLCDRGFELADRVDALAVEVLDRRAGDGVAVDSELALPASTAREARHLARAHAAALRDAARAGRSVTDQDAEAGTHLYQAVVTLGRETVRRRVPRG